MAKEQVNKQKQNTELPEYFSIPNRYDIPDRVQGNENNCTSITFASLLEYQLSDHFKERTIVDADDLWKKQRELGTATEEGDFMDGPFIIATKYGARFKTDSGREGTVFLSGRGWFIIMDDSILMRFLRFFRRKRKAQREVSAEQTAYNKAVGQAWGDGFKVIGSGANKIRIEAKITALADDAALAIQQLSRFEVTIKDEEKTAKAIEKINNDFKGKRVGGIGATGGPTPDGFYFLGQFFLSLAFQWVTRHALQDLDDGLWKSLKTALKKLFESLKRLGKDSDKLAVMMSKMPYDKSIPTIVFLFPRNLSGQDFLNALENAREIAVDVINQYSVENGIAVYEYTYISLEHGWDLKTKGFSGVL